MPCAAKVWKIDIVDSRFHLFLRSKFGSTREGGNTSSINDPNKLPLANLPGKKRRGLYSIGTLPTTNYSATQPNREDDITELRSNTGEVNSDRHCSGSSVPAGGKQRTQEDFQSLETIVYSSVSYSDLSNYLTGQ